MAQQAAGKPYEDVLAQRVYQPLGLTATSLPSGAALPSPTVHGYGVDPPLPPDDVTEAFAAGWTWASGGQVSTPGEANTFVRGYVSGKTSRPDGASSRSSSSGPGRRSRRARARTAPDPGVFRYQTSCGTVYGHTGNTAGFTQFIASSRDGKRSTVVSINSQLTPAIDGSRFAELRKIYGLGRVRGDGEERGVTARRRSTPIGCRRSSRAGRARHDRRRQGAGTGRPREVRCPTAPVSRSPAAARRPGGDVARPELRRACYVFAAVIGVLVSARVLGLPRARPPAAGSRCSATSPTPSATHDAELVADPGARPRRPPDSRSPSRSSPAAAVTSPPTVLPRGEHPTRRGPGRRARLPSPPSGSGSCSARGATHRDRRGPRRSSQ